MLCKYVKGRLGNQMFQYSTLRGFQQKYFPNDKICLSFEKVKKKAKRENFSQIDSLKDFNCDYITINKIKLNIKQKFLILLLSSILFVYKYILKNNYSKKRDYIEEKFSGILIKNNIVWKTLGYKKIDLSKINKNKDIIFYGYFESPKYFDFIKEILINDFEPKKELINKNKDLLEIIKNSNSVCISIRRGDFITNKKYNRDHFICDENYFNKAINIMNKKIKNPKYIVFSDDINWVRKNMIFPENTLFESGNDPVWEKLRLMKNCKHFIVSNSSFSWWSQFLSSNSKKIIIAPKIWNKNNNNRDMYDSKWITI